MLQPCTPTTNLACHDITIPALTLGTRTKVPAGFKTFEVGQQSTQGEGDDVVASDFQQDSDRLTVRVIRASPTNPTFIKPYPPYTADVSSKFITTGKHKHVVVYAVLKLIWRPFF